METVRPLISIIGPCYNEAENIAEFHRRLEVVFALHPEYAFELIFIDNCSTDGTADIIKGIASHHPHVKLIVNARNFGHIRSPFYGILQGTGDAIILMATDLQDPPELVSDFLKHWQQGYKVVAAVKNATEESRLFHAMRSSYYRFLAAISEAHIIEHFTGFGLYDRTVIELLRDCPEQYPYLRGMIADMGFDVAQVPFFKPSRKRGITKNNFYTLFDMAMLGITSHSRVPLRLSMLLGFFAAGAGFLLALVYLVLKLVYWDKFAMGQAPTMIGLLILGSVQLFFIGLIGEYILAINARTQKRPLVVERERVNFEPSK